MWRVNSAPTFGFERFVGARTSVRVLNHVAVDVWRGAARPKAYEFAGVGGEFPRSLCNNTVCLLADAAVGGGAAATAVLRLDPTLRRRVTPSCAPKRQSSTGFLAAALALRACRRVTLYGFFGECCGNDVLPSMRYKYFHTSNSSWVCCASGREDFESEVQALKSHSRVTARLAARCLVVGAAPIAPAAPLPGAHVVWDRLFLVNHVSNRGFRGAASTRVLGDTTIELLLGRPPAEAGVRARGAARLCSGDVEECLFFPKYADLRRYAGRSHGLLLDAARAGHEIAAVSAHTAARALLLKHAADRGSRNFTRTKVSGGLATAVLALSRCAAVDVIGAETTPRESCCVRGGAYRVGEDQESTAASRARCCALAREPRTEYAAWQALRASGRLRVWSVI